MSAKVRIVGGLLRGRVLTVPGGIRPTANRVRESLMSIWLPRLPGARFLDLFAGSGAIGIEAVSRGAARVVLVDSDHEVIAELTRNCEAMVEIQSTVLLARAPEGLSGVLDESAIFDLIFADPPYAFADYRKLLRVSGGFLAPNGSLAVEHDRRRDLPEDSDQFQLVDRRQYGDSCLSFYEVK